MNMKEQVHSRDSAGATMLFGASIAEQLHAEGVYTAVCTGPIEARREEFCALRDEILERERDLLETASWGRKHLGLFTAMTDREAAEQLIRESRVLAQKRAQLAAIPTEEKWRDVAHNVVTTVGKNLICEGALSNTAQGTVAMGLKSAGTAVAADTMASHASWTEITNFAARLAPSFSAASGGSKATSATVNFAFTSGSSVTVAGCFLVVAGSTTIGNTTGTLLSAGDFSGGNKIASSGDTVQVTYSLGV